MDLRLERLGQRRRGMVGFGTWCRGVVRVGGMADLGVLLGVYEFLR